MAKTAKRPRIGVLLGERSNPFWTEMQGQYLAIAKEHGLSVNPMWPSPSQSPSSQLRTLRGMLSKGFDAIIVNPMTATNLVPAILEADAKGVPLVDVGAKTDSKAFGRKPHHYIPLKTVDFREQGKIGGSYIVRRLESTSGGDVAIIQGREDSSQSVGRSQGAAEALAQEPSICLVYKGPADFSRRKAKAVAKRILASQPKLRAFFCANDVMALGTADAIEQAGMRGRIIVVGVDFIPEAREAIRCGLMTASVAFSVAEVVHLVLTVTVDVLTGRAPSATTGIRSLLVDISNLEAYLASR